MLTGRIQWQIWAWGNHSAEILFHSFPKRWNFILESLFLLHWAVIPDGGPVHLNCHFLVSEIHTLVGRGGGGKKKVSSKLVRSLKPFGVKGSSGAWYLKIFEDLGISLYLNGLWLQISTCIPSFTETVDMSKNFCDFKGKMVWKSTRPLFSEGHCYVFWHISRKYNELTSGYQDFFSSSF